MTKLDFSKNPYSYIFYYDDNGKLVGINDCDLNELAKYKIIANAYDKLYNLGLEYKSDKNKCFYDRLFLNYGFKKPSIIYQDTKDVRNSSFNIDYIRFTILSQKLDLPEKLKRAWIDLAYETIFKRADLTK